MRVLLISTYDLGRQPLGLAVPAARLRSAGADVDCVDVSRETLGDAEIDAAGLVAFYLPMHTATRLAGPLINRVRHLNPRARLAAYGLYAPLNATWLRDQGVHDVLGPDAEDALVAIANLKNPKHPSHSTHPTRPDRSTLVPLERYAALQMPDGTRRVVGSTDATHGCKHLCRHCPIVPVYEGRFKAVPIAAVLDDIGVQVEAGAQHISFGDPDFFNGPTHARRLVERFAQEHPQITYDATIKIEHLLRHRDLLPLLRQTGCLMVTSAVESVDDRILEHLRKGHTRADFIEAVGLCRQAGLAIAPTFVPFTPWTTVDGYRDLLETIESLDLTRAVAPIQLAIRLLVTAQSKLLELPDIAAVIEPFDAQSLTYPWRHADASVDALQRDVMQLVASGGTLSRGELFDRIADRARGADLVSTSSNCCGSSRSAQAPPFMTEAWYCCAEPGPDLLDFV